MTGSRTSASLLNPGRKGFRPRALAMLVAARFIALGCGSSATKSAPPETETVTIYPRQTPAADVLLVLQDWSGESSNQKTLLYEMPALAAGLEAAGPLDLHIALITADMGAPGIPAGIGCTAPGDDGAFRSAPRGTCTTSGLAAGATYLTDDGSCVTNFTGEPGKVLQCIGDMGNGGCGFGQPLAAAVHALGADNIVAGVPTPPATNAGFLRPNAALGVFFLSDQDDCSAPTDSTVFSLTGEQNLANPLGPLGLYRCNRYGHLCKDPASGQPQSLAMPPLSPPADAQGTPAQPMLNLSDCQDNDTATGLLTPVSKLVSELKALKPAPDNQIVVGMIAGPPTPYTVEWLPALGGQDTQPGELWPQVMLSCGHQGDSSVSPSATQFTTGGTSAEPGVRLAEFADKFPLGVQASNCADTYVPTLQTFATKVAEAATGCLIGAIQLAADGTPACTGTAVIQDSTGKTENVSYPACAANGNVAPCWTLSPSTDCPGGHVALNAPAPPTSFTLTCTVSKPGASVDGGPPGNSVPTPQDAGGRDAAGGGFGASTYPCGPSGSLVCSCGAAPYFFPAPTTDAGQPQAPDAASTDPYTTVAGFDALAVGRWRRTAGAGELPCEQFGIDFTSDHQMIPLVIASDGSVEQVTERAISFGISFADPNIVPAGFTAPPVPYMCSPTEYAGAPQFFDADQSMFLLYAPWPANYVRVN